MIGYVTLGTNKYDEAAKFYDGLLGLLGAGRMMDTDTFIAWQRKTETSCGSSVRLHPTGN